MARIGEWVVDTNPYGSGEPGQIVSSYSSGHWMVRAQSGRTFTVPKHRVRVVSAPGRDYGGEQTAPGPGVVAVEEPVEEIGDLFPGATSEDEEGVDLRDLGPYTNGSAVPIETIPVRGPSNPAAGLGLVGLLARMPWAIAVLVRRWFSGYSTGGVVSWGSIPGWVRTALVSVGAVVGADIVMDLIPGGDDDGGNGVVQADELEQTVPLLPDHPVPHMVDGHLGAHIVGSWVANGVTFYRLSDGKLAVQNKKGRWKTWKPKRPIVLYSDGASDLKTMLRADAALQRQAEKIKKMLARRTGTRAPRTKKQPERPIIVQNGRVIDV